MDVVTNVLIMTEPNEVQTGELTAFLRDRGCHVYEEMTLGPAIEKAQNIAFDVIVLNAEAEAIEITRVIRILKELNPASKIIVKTTSNSESLEVKVRREKIFYYHLNSFGVNELKLAIESALK